MAPPWVSHLSHPQTSVLNLPLIAGLYCRSDRWFYVILTMAQGATLVLSICVRMFLGKICISVGGLNQGDYLHGYTLGAAKLSNVLRTFSMVWICLQRSHNENVVLNATLLRGTLKIIRTWRVCLVNVLIELSRVGWSCKIIKFVSLNIFSALWCLLLSDFIPPRAAPWFCTLLPPEP